MTTPTISPQQITAADLIEHDTIVDKTSTKWKVTALKVGDTVHLRIESDGEIRTVDFPLDRTVTVLRAEPFSQEKRDVDLETRTAEIDAAQQKYGNVAPPPPPPTPYEAAKTVTDTLGGQVVAVETAEAEHDRQAADATGAPLELPLWEKMSEPERLTHLYLIHGVWGYDVTRPGELTDLHDAAHTSSQTMTPHTHSEDAR
jgi:hypothetical protein